MSPRLPQVTAKEIIKFLKSRGFVEDRQTGSHLTLKKDERSVTVPVHTKVDMGRGLAVRVLKQAGFTADDYMNR